MRAHADRSRRFVFDAVVEDYVRGRPRVPLEVVDAAAGAVGLGARARVLEIGAGAGQLTETIVRAGFEVVALEPGAALRKRAALVAPFAEMRAETFEDYTAPGRFDAVFSANAFHWVDPAVGYPKAADVADALVLIWDTPFIADADLHRRVQEEVMAPRGSTFPSDEAGVRALVTSDAAAGRSELTASARFDQLWWRVFEQTLRYTPDQYVSLLQSMSGVAAQPDDVRVELGDALRVVLGDQPFDVIDLVYVVAARARP